MYSLELDELYEKKYDLEEKINNFFNGDDIRHSGDRNYQELLEQLDEINKEIEDISNSQ